MMRATMMTALAVGTAASLGCAGGQDPALGAEPQQPQTTMLAVNDAEIGRQSGVQIRVSPVSRTSRYANEGAQRPVHLEIRNESGRPLSIRHEAIALEHSGGEPMAAVPVVRLAEDVPGVAGAPIEFEQREFRIASEYAERYPDIPVYEGAFEVTAIDAYRAGEAMEPIGLRDVELLADALPEGVLMSGGRVAGVVWFSEIPGDSTLAFSMDLVDASTGEQFGEIRVPVDLSGSMLQPGTETWDPNMADAAEPVDVMVVLNASDPSSYESRRVQLQNVRVQKVVSDRVFWVGPDGGQWLLVTHGDPTSMGPISATPIQEGQTVTLVGELRTPPGAAQARAAWRLDQTGADMLGRSRLYLVADDVRTY